MTKPLFQICENPRNLWMFFFLIFVDQFGKMDVAVDREVMEQNGDLSLRILAIVRLRP